MKGLRLHRLALMLALLGGVVATAPAVAQEQSLDPAATVVNPRCRWQAANGDAAAGPDGITRGFVRFHGRGCGDRLWYFQGRRGSWTSQRSPFRGGVAAVTQDATGTYVLYGAPDGGMRLAKRTAAGSFTQVRRLSSSGADPEIIGSYGADGDVVASGGRWWAVWSEDPGPGRATEVFQAKTIGVELDRVQVTPGTDESPHDSEPSLVLRPDGGAVMVWSITDYGGHGTELGHATAGADGRWRLGTLPTPPFTGGYFFEGHGDADVLTVGGVTFAGWDHSASRLEGTLWDRVYVADDRRGSFVRHSFRHQGTGVRLAASGGRVFAAWTTRNEPRRAFVAQRPLSGGVWTGRILPGAGGDHELMALTATSGEATALILGTSRLYARTLR